jgi:hypothetical protein
LPPDLLQYRYTSHQLLARHTNLSLRSLPASFIFCAKASMVSKLAP